MGIEMKLIRSAFFVTALTALNASAQPGPQPSPPPNAPPNAGAPRVPPSFAPGAPAKPPTMPDKDKLSYGIGFNIANSIKRDSVDVDVDTIAAAMKDVLAGRPTRMTEQEVKETMTQFQQAMRAKMMAEHEKQLAENKAKGEEFLANNAKDPAVKSLPNGLEYKVLKEGSGDMPKPTDTVTVSYKGSLIDGTVFDQNEHFTTPVTGRTIKGWSEILPLMRTGSKWEVAIPADLAYGQRGSPPKIGPNSALIFDMELLSISIPAASPAPGPTPVSNRVSPPPSLSGGPPSPATTTPVVSGQIIKVPSAEELKHGAKIEVITNAPNQ
jgi:FKBP-type peptidyl-prolyl cis-trans isomerase FklB